MLRIVIIISLFLIARPVTGQVRFRTIAPQQAVTAGEAFQVQYVLEDAKKLVAINPPAFTGFRFVAGPHNYSGNVSSLGGSKPVFNAVYTLEAIRPGQYNLPGAAAIVNGKIYRSNDVKIEVISKQEAVRRLGKNIEQGNSAYFLRPGEDAYKKIRENLFVKVMVDKQTCFAGEPLLATFKLYSRLESKSDIIKNPGFYGFTVYDMVNLEDRESVVEDINGKKFDVHTIRKVQLFPLQPGLFTIDPMEIKNRVEFSRSMVNKSTEQEIVEGVADLEEDEPAAGTEVFETTMRTEPVSVKVKPVPGKNQPESYNGAVGHYTISASMKKDKLGLNEQGALEITISGNGNFVQLDAPTVKWPEGIEGFPATVNDQFDKSQIPLAGTRTFIYPFVAVKPGTWNLEPISFSFYDLDSNGFITTKTKSVNVEVTPAAANNNNNEPGANIKLNKGRNSMLIISMALLILIAWGVWIYKKKNSKKVPDRLEETVTTDANQNLQPAYAALNQEGNGFYVLLQGILWKQLSEKFGVKGSNMSKSTISGILAGKGIGKENIGELVSILEHLETGIFTGTDPEISRKELLDRTSNLLESFR